MPRVYRPVAIEIATLILFYGGVENPRKNRLRLLFLGRSVTFLNFLDYFISNIFWTSDVV